MPQDLIQLNKKAIMQKWAERIKACRSSNLSVRTWCKQNNIAYSTYYTWQKKLFQTAITTCEKNTLQFAEIPVTTEIVEMPTRTVTAVPEVIATLEINSITAKLYSNANPEAISAICRGLTLC